MSNFIVCSAKTFISFIRNSFTGAALAGAINSKKANPVMDIKDTYNKLGFDSTNAEARLKRQIDSIRDDSDARIRDIMGTIESMRVSPADKAALVDAAIAGQSRAIIGPLNTIWKTAEQSNEAIRFIGNQLKEDGRVLTKDSEITEYVLENAFDSWLTIPQHRIRGNAAKFDAFVKDHLGAEGLAGRAGKDQKQHIDKANEIVQGELKGNNALVKYLMTEANVRASSRAEAIDRINWALYKAADGAEGGGDSVLNIIANSFKGLQDAYHSKMVSIDELYVKDKEMRFSGRPDQHVVAANPDEFKTFAKEHFDRGDFLGIYGLNTGKLTQHRAAELEALFDKELDTFVGRIINNDTFSMDSGFKQFDRVYDKHNITILDAGLRAEYVIKFTHQYGGPLGDTISRMRSRIKQASFAEVGHNHPSRLLGDIKFFLNDTHKNIKPEIIDRVIGKTESKIKDIVGTPSLLSPTAQNYARGVNSMLSTVTGASALRNWYDYVVHSAMVKALVTEGEAPLTKVANFIGNIFKDTKTLTGLTVGAARDNFGSSFGRTTSANSRAVKLANFWEKQGAYIQITRATMNRGFSDAMEGAKFRDDASAVSKGFNKFFEKSQDIVNDISFADATNIAGRAMHTNQVGGMLFEALGTDFNTAYKQLGKKLDRYGIGENEWAVLQKLEDIGADEFGVNISKKLEYTVEEMDALLSGVVNPGFKDLVLKAGRATENNAPHIITRRILGAYQNMMNAAIDELASTPGVRGTTFEGNSNSLVKALYDMSIGKFLNITFSQWYQLYRAMLDAIGLNPNLAGSYNLGVIGKLAREPRLLGYMGGALVAQTGAGMMYMWMKDLAAGDAPREFSWRNAREASLSNGFAGVWGAMLGNLQYGDVPFGTPATAFIRPIRKGVVAAAQGDGRKLGSAGFDAAKRVLGPLDVWWMRGVYDKKIKQQFIPLDKRQRAYRKKRGQDKTASRWLQGVFE